ncbi:hypothetical protein PCANC_12645 [Puccinia coronata f. sp. avenae]|uniref:Uncharacterized protein n=1 Tax=Puccinia coronata f. sp. avenae TaxID=200324 RepID=A0A2N5T2W9_9BASI|nr:hypothetical protein PCANC_12645 [Puccinia coronata f. sp. avenae]
MSDLPPDPPETQNSPPPNPPLGGKFNTAASFSHFVRRSRVVVHLPLSALLFLFILTHAYYSKSGTGEEPPGKLGPVQLVGRASRQAGYCPASLGEPPDQLALHQLESLPISWHYTSLLGEPPNQLALHQLVGRASRPAGNVSRRESLPTSSQCISSVREPPDLGGQAPPS